MSGEQMPKDQSDYINKLKDYCKDATNMTDEEAYNFAFRCWQLDMSNHIVRAPRREFLRFTGRGSCFNTKEGSTSAFYRMGTSMLMIDCGESTFADLIKKDILDGVADIHILITHFHTDHIGSLPSLLYYCEYILGISVDIYTTTPNILDCFLNLTMYGDKIYQRYKESSFNVHKIEINKMFTIDASNMTFVVCPIKEYHVEIGSLHSVGYCLGLCSNGEIASSIYYSGDTSSANISDAISKYPSTIDYFYLDAADRGEEYPHESMETIMKLARNYQIDLYKIRLIHIDSDDVLIKAKELGLKPVEIY